MSSDGLPTWYHKAHRDPTLQAELREMTFNYLQSFGLVEVSEIVKQMGIHPIYQNDVDKLIMEWKLNKGA